METKMRAPFLDITDRLAKLRPVAFPSDIANEGPDADAAAAEYCRLLDQVLVTAPASMIGAFMLLVAVRERIGSADQAVLAHAMDRALAILRADIRSADKANIEAAGLDFDAVTQVVH